MNEKDSAFWYADLFRAALSQTDDVGEAVAVADHAFANAAALGLDAEGNWHGPTPPNANWVQVGEGERGGKVWKRQGGGVTPQQPRPEARGRARALKAGESLHEVIDALDALATAAEGDEAEALYAARDAVVSARETSGAAPRSPREATAGDLRRRLREAIDEIDMAGSEEEDPDTRDDIYAARDALVEALGGLPGEKPAAAQPPPPPPATPPTPDAHVAQAVAANPVAAQAVAAAGGVGKPPLAESDIGGFLERNNLAGWAQGLDEADRNAVAAYQAGSSRNGWLRGKAPEWDHAQVEWARGLDRTLAAAPPLKEPVTVLRGLDLREDYSRELIDSLRPGVEFQDHGFTSTTLSSAYMDTFHAPAAPRESDAVVEIRVPAGTKAGYITGVLTKGSGEADTSLDKEKELLLPRGGKYRVVEVGKYREHGIRVVVEYLGSEPRPLPEVPERLRKYYQQ